MKGLLVSAVVCGSITLFSSQVIGASLIIDGFAEVTGDPSTYQTCQNFVPDLTPDHTCLFVAGSNVPGTVTNAESLEEGLKTPPTGTVVGGTRQVNLNYRGSIDSSSFLEIMNGQLQLNNNSGANSQALVTWNSGGLGLGSFSAYDRFEVDLDPNSDFFTLALTVTGAGSVEKSVLKGITDVSAPVLFNFCEFTGNCADSNPDLSFFNSVSSLVMTLSGNNGYDTNINSIRALGAGVPNVHEPSLWLDSLIIFVLGCGGIKWGKK